jgi:DNA-directed RNA polymerase subunit RPC12/RpoP
VLICPHCKSGVGEESCTGCIRDTPHYLCGNCQKIVPNPYFLSGVQCSACGKYIYEEASKSNRHMVKLYVCQTCGHVENNPKFTNFHSCEGCKPPVCGECGKLLASNSLIDYWVCSGCGKQTKKISQ